MPLASPLLETIVNEIADTLYMRQTDEQANIEVDLSDIAGITLCIYNNLPTVTQTSLLTGFTYREWPVEMKIVRLADMDDDTIDGDAIRLICLGVADQIYDKVHSTVPPDSNVSSIITQEGSDIEFLDVVKIYDKTLTGLTLSFSLFFDKDNNVCRA